MEFEHSKKGTTWKKHKYLRIENGKYIYKDSSGRTSAGNNAAYRYKWINRYEQEAKENKAKVYSNGVNMYTRKDGTTVITYPGHAAWTVPVGTNLVKLSARLESMAKSYKMGGLQSSDPTKKAKATEDFLNALNNVIGGSSNVKGGTAGDPKPKEQSDEQPKEQKPEEQKPEEQPQNPAPAPQQQSQPDVSGAQEQKPRMVTGAEAESSKSRLKRIGVRKNKLYEEAQKLTEQLSSDPKNEELREEVNDLYDEIDHYNDEVVEHITTLKDFGLSNDDIVKYAESIDISIDPNTLEPYYLNLKNREKRNAVSSIQHKLTKSLYDMYFKDSFSEEELKDDEIAHIGRSKRDGAKVGSGRYPLGSGENPRAEKRKLFGSSKEKHHGQDNNDTNGKYGYKNSAGTNNNYNNRSQNQNNQNNQQKPNGNQNQNKSRNEDNYQKQLSDLQRQYNQQMQTMMQMQQMQMISNQQHQQEMNRLNQQYQQALSQVNRSGRESNDRERTVKLSEKEWNSLMKHINDSNAEIAKLSKQKEDMSRNYKESKSKTSKYGKIVIGGAALYLLYKAVNNMTGGNTNDLIRELKDVAEETAINEVADRAKQKLGATGNPINKSQKDKSQKDKSQNGKNNGIDTRKIDAIARIAKVSAEKGVKEGVKEGAETVAKGTTMVATKRAVDSLVGRDVSDTIFTAANPKNSNIYNNLYNNERNTNKNYDQYSRSPFTDMRSVLVTTGDYTSPVILPNGSYKKYR